MVGLGGGCGMWVEVFGACLLFYKIHHHEEMEGLKWMEKCSEQSWAELIQENEQP